MSRPGLFEVVGVDAVGGVLQRLDALGRAAHAARNRPVAEGVAVDVPRPRVLRDRRANRRREVEPSRRRLAHIERREDAIALRVALEAVDEPERLAGEAVEHALAEVPERRVPEVMRARRGLHHDRVAAVLEGERAGR